MQGTGRTFPVKAMGVAEIVIILASLSSAPTAGNLPQAVVPAQLDQLRMEVPQEGHGGRQPRCKGEALIGGQVGEEIRLEERLEAPKPP